MTTNFNFFSLTFEKKQHTTTSGARIDNKKVIENKRKKRKKRKRNIKSNRVKDTERKRI